MISWPITSHSANFLHSGQLTSLTPPTDTLGANRFQIKNPGSVPAVFETKVKA